MSVFVLLLLWIGKSDGNDRAQGTTLSPAKALVATASKAPFQLALLSQRKNDSLHHRQAAAILDHHKSRCSCSSGSSRNHIDTILFSLRAGGAALPQPLPSDLARGAFEWCSQLILPSAVIAVAIASTTMQNSDHHRLNKIKTTRSNNNKWLPSQLLECLKTYESMLLFKAFALECLALFVTTVTGTMLLSRDHRSFVVDETCNTPLSFLQKYYEFEFLSCQICFLGGLLCWVAAIIMGFALPKQQNSTSLSLRDAKALRRFELFKASALSAMFSIMYSFWNQNLVLYSNYYPAMAKQWSRLLVQRMSLTWPPSPPALVFILFYLRTIQLGIQTLLPGREEDNGTILPPL